MQYLILIVDNQSTAQISEDIMKRYFGFAFEFGDPEDVYHAVNNITEQMANVTLLLDKHDED